MRELSEDEIYLFVGLIMAGIWIIARTVMFVTDSLKKKPDDDNIWGYVGGILGGVAFCVTFGPAVLMVASCIGIIIGIPYLFIKGLVALIYYKR